MEDFFDKLHEECGVFGIYNVNNASELTYYGLHALQHRGQEGTGIVSYDGEFNKLKGPGLVTEVFNESNLKTLTGNIAIGHVRYSNNNSKGMENIQPLYFKHHTGDFAICHNGNIVNSSQLRMYLEKKGSIFQSSSDSEILAHLIKKNVNTESRIPAIVDALNMLEGAFAFLIMTKDRIYACRDKYGFHPLSLASYGDGFVVASETCAFDVIGAKFIRDVEPGEILIIEGNSYHSVLYSQFKKHKMCAMEYIYFARPDSDIDGRNVHAFRKESGRLLYREHPIKGDIVVGVPDSSLSAAIGYAEESGISYEMGLIKNKYIGRTFIAPSQELRDKGVRMKLSAVSSIVKDKVVILIDDSIVRGTTSKRIITMLKEAGAKEVHLCIAAPELKHPCFYGVDISSYDELISANHSVEEIRDIIGADSLHFLSEKSLLEASKRTDMCLSCFCGKYVTSLYGEKIKEN